MSQCIDGFKHVCSSFFRCFDIDIYKQSGGLGDPELLARETVCMLSASFPSYFSFHALIFVPLVDALCYEECKSFFLYFDH